MVPLTCYNAFVPGIVGLTTTTIVGQSDEITIGAVFMILLFVGLCAGIMLGRR
jgi:hypothetical protein